MNICWLHWGATEIYFKRQLTSVTKMGFKYPQHFTRVLSNRQELVIVFTANHMEQGIHA
jgi:hypothetical protein